MVRTIRRLSIFSLTLAPFLHAQERPVAFVDVTVIPMDKEQILPHQPVVIQSGRITQVGSAASVKVPRGALKIDGKGKFLMPGLADMHVHFMRSARPTKYRNKKERRMANARYQRNFRSRQHLGVKKPLRSLTERKDLQTPFRVLGAPVPARPF
jgi:imidazolonepropionase-like amidohydrolase